MELIKLAIFSKDALEGKHILITGATGGIGFETAKVIASMGASVTVTGRKVDTLENLKQELLSITDEEKIFTKVADLSNESDRIELIKSCEDHLGFIYGLVNTAAIMGGTVVDQLEEEDVRSMIDVNYISTFSLTKLVYQKMREKKAGAIVNVSSLSGLRGTYANAAYSASKFALIGFTQSLALEAIQENIRVNAVCPGFVDTKMANEYIEINAKANNVSFEEQKSKSEKSIPSGRFTAPIEVANTIAFLLTDAANNIVGESVKISGGAVMR
ncbi:SDR family NAD(P)-dependent oxidoreductase [Bacillus sp. 03113]|uniref:SDR family NAD(P)-dependent oxidoreductase n=1 Tax=Bacillus sp. 03113 TaxID=2578211 RepID=UPI00215C1B1A|nr:SDR family NAD(P)-dependent oxidoreductase [Bacillus sp. 03113]